MTTTTDLAVRGNHVQAQQAALAIRPGQITWDEFQNAALDQLGLKGASNADKAVFLHQCQRTGLDPFARQIYMIGRPEKQPDGKWGTKWTIQTGIDGYRVNRARAEREHGVRGVLGRAVFYDHDGTEHKVWVQQRPPAACEITYTVRDAAGNETPYTSVLRFDEYVQTKTENGQRVPVAQWAVKPAHMLEKCTEADVYRKAFPQDFSGMHLDDAMPPVEEMPAQPQRQRVSADMARQRRTTVTATAETVTPDVPPATTAPPSPPAGQRAAGGTAAGGGNSPSPASSGQRSQIMAQFKRLGTDPGTEEGWTTALRAVARIIGIAAIADLAELTSDEAVTVLDWLKKLDSRELARLAADEDGVTGAAGGEPSGE